MKKIVFLMFFLILASSCTIKQNKPNVVYKYIEKPVYIKCKKPEIPKKPDFIPYQLLRVKFEDSYYYCVNEENARILTTNYLTYRDWCNSLLNLLKEGEK